MLLNDSPISWIVAFSPLFLNPITWCLCLTDLLTHSLRNCRTKDDAFSEHCSKATIVCLLCEFADDGDTAKNKTILHTHRIPPTAPEAQPLPHRLLNNQPMMTASDEGTSQANSHITWIWIGFAGSLTEPSSPCRAVCARCRHVRNIERPFKDVRSLVIQDAAEYQRTKMMIITEISLSSATESRLLLLVC